MIKFELNLIKYTIMMEPNFWIQFIASSNCGTNLGLYKTGENKKEKAKLVKEMERITLQS